MTDTRFTSWFLLDRTHGDYAGIRLKLITRHAFFWPDNVFSEVLSDDKLQGLLKMEGGDPDWHSINSDVLASAATLDNYTRADHGRAVTLLNTHPNWTETRG